MSESMRGASSLPAGPEGKVVVPLLVAPLTRPDHWSQEADPASPGLHTAAPAIVLRFEMVGPSLAASVPKPPTAP